MKNILGRLKTLFHTPNEIKDLEDIIFIEIDANDIAKLHPDALYDLFKSKKHGFLIKNFLNNEELQMAIKYAHQNKDRNPAFTDVGYTYPMVFQEFSLRNTNNDSFEQNKKTYFYDNKIFNDSTPKTIGFDLSKKLNDFFKSLSVSRKVAVPSGMDKIGNYLFGNFRHLFPTGGLMSVHCGNFFGENFKLVYAHLCETINVVNQMSYFVMIQKPDVGGELTIFNLRWLPGQGKTDFAEDEEVILADGSIIKIDKNPLIKSYKLAPEPGDMILFQGGNIWHRVEKVFGEKERITFGGFMGVDKDDSTIYYWT